MVISSFMDRKLTVWRTGFKGSLKDFWQKAPQFLAQKATLLPQGCEIDSFHLSAGTFLFTVAQSLKVYFLRLAFLASILLGVIDSNCSSLGFSYPLNTHSGLCLAWLGVIALSEGRQSHTHPSFKFSVKRR